MNTIVVDCSAGYNLAVHRLAAWLKGQDAAVQVFDRLALPGDLDLAWADRVYLSAVFSWDLPPAAALARRAQELGRSVEIGGPAAEYNAGWVERETGIAPWRGRHPCETVEVENPRMTWTSRGCPNRCPFCIVWQVDGGLVELDDWQPAPLLMDDNFLACSETHQERVIARLAKEGLRNVDFNQGLDARRYAPAFRELLDRYGVRLQVWRFAYDRAGDWAAVERAIRDLHQAGVHWTVIRVYLLYNYREMPAEAIERAEQIIGSREHPRACPWPMAYKPLDWMEPGDYVAPGWTLQEVRDVRRYYGRPILWRSATWEEYDRGYIRGAEARGYPANWDEIARRVKGAAGWRCEHCGHPHEPDAGYTLTVHHLDGDPANNAPSNLVALCQRCHLSVQAKFSPGQSVMDFARPEWMTARGLGQVESAPSAP